MTVGMGSERWTARPKWASFLRVLSVLLPLAAAYVAASLVGVMLPAPAGWWWLAVATAGVLAAWVSLPWSSRLQLLAMTYEIELLFPGRAPGRVDVVKLVGRPELLRSPPEPASELARQIAGAAAADFDPEVVYALLMADESQLRSVAGGSAPLRRLAARRRGPAGALVTAFLMITGMALTGSLLPRTANTVRVDELLAIFETTSTSASLTAQATATSLVSSIGASDDPTTSSAPGSPSSTTGSSAPATTIPASGVSRPGASTTTTQAPTTTTSTSSTTSIPGVTTTVVVTTTTKATTTTTTTTTTTKATTTTTGPPSPTTTQAPTTTTTLEPTTTTLEPTTTTTLEPTTTTTPPSNCDAAYPTVCIPSPPPDLNCEDISESNFSVLPPDPHGFDGDSDGIGCET